VIAAVELLGTAFLALLALLSMRAALAQAEAATATTYRLTFPTGLEGESVLRVLVGVCGLLQPRWRRVFHHPVVIFETEATSLGIAHRLIVAANHSAAVEAALSAHVPSVRWQPVEQESSTRPLRAGAEYRTSTDRRALRSDPVAISQGLLSALQPLGHDERVLVQWIVSPVGPVRPARMVSKNDQGKLLNDAQLLDNSEELTALKSKLAHPLLLATGRIAVAAGSRDRARALLRRTEGPWHGTRAPGVHLERRAFSAGFVAARATRRTVPITVWPSVLNADELTGLIGWPLEAVSLPGLPLGGCRLVAASPLIPSTGTVIADATFPGNPRPLAIETEGRLRHVHVLGPTGTGKSTLLVNMAVQDLHAGRGLVLLDPKGDLVEAVLERVPPQRRDDVIVLDPADSNRPVGLNPLNSVDRDHAEVVVENLVGLFKSLYRHSWGPRLDDILRAALLTLAHADGATLCEVPLILTNANYRQRLVSRLDDPVGLEPFWGWFEAISPSERQLAIGPVLNKLRAFTMRPRIRSMIGQSKPALQLRDVIGNGKVLLVSLASGLLGDEAAALMGALVVAELWHATLARASQPAASRRPVMAYLDEWQHFMHLPTPMSSVLAEARGMGLGMVLAHQHLDQLPEESRKAVLANARSKVVFQLAAADARLMERELGEILSVDDLQGLGAYEVAVQLYANGMVQPVATGKTRLWEPATGSASDIRGVSRERYGVQREDVERQIRARQSFQADAPTGRRTRGGAR
jgi:hypothetical protein